MGVTLVSLSALALATASGQPEPQDADTPPAATAPDAPESTEVVVTAQRREETIQSVPIAISAFTQNTLTAQRIDGGPLLQQAVPNMTFSRGQFTGTNLQIRGVGTKIYAPTADSATGIHLNNAPLTTNRIFEAEFYDLERLEVLRGPQGTLYGRNATGGVVNTITAKPKLGSFDGKVRAEYGNYDSVRLIGHVNVPLGDEAAFRIAAAAVGRDGFGVNRFTGDRIDDRNLWSVRATFRVEPAPWFRLWALAEHFEESDRRPRATKPLCGKDLGPTAVGGVATSALTRNFLSQACLPTRVNDPASLGTANSAATLPGLLAVLYGYLPGDAFAGVTQEANLRNINASFDPEYRANTDVYQANLDIDLGSALTLSSLTSYTNDRIYAFQDFYRVQPTSRFSATPQTPGGVIADPQLGTSDRLLAADSSAGRSTQFSQELRLQSKLTGPFNFNIGGLLLNFDQLTDYYVLANTLTAAARRNPAVFIDPASEPSGIGRNYFASRAPYELRSRAVFGEGYYQLTPTLKATAGLRYTDDKKTLFETPVVLLQPGQGLAVSSVGVARFREVTGRAGLDWKPELGFTDDTLVYAFYSRGYKGGGLNPAAAVGSAGVQATYAPEFINAYELGTKNSLFDRRLTLNASAFYYNYGGYQVSRTIQRRAVTDNVDARIYGLELEAVARPVAGLKLNANLGLLRTRIRNGQLIDTFDRSQGDAGWQVVKASNASACIAPVAGVAAVLQRVNAGTLPSSAILSICSGAYASLGATPSEGVVVDLRGKQLPNAPKMTVNMGAEYAMPLGSDLTITARADYYRQEAAFARVYNIAADRLPAWENVNFTLRVDMPARGATLEAFVKNAFDAQAITDTYLSDDATGLTRNVFLMEPRTYGVALTYAF